MKGAGYGTEGGAGWNAAIDERTDFVMVKGAGRKG